MDWTVVDSLNARFQTWKLKYENILKAELACLPDTSYASLFLDGEVTKA